MWVRDYRPISLIHSIAKILSKILANRLAPKLQEMVSANQSAFVKKRCIHDNFLYVQGIIKELTKKKEISTFSEIGHCKSF